MSDIAMLSQTTLTFTPQHAAMGGLILGISVVGNLLLNGRVLGISGTVKGLVQGDRSSWRWAFLLGLLGAAPYMGILLPSSFEAIPFTTSLMARSLISGLLVGLGASMGNGCTSGHGICGNARLSIRSMVYTCTFMAAGILAATLSKAAEAYNIAKTAAIYQPLSPAQLDINLTLVGGSVGALVAIAILLKLAQAIQRKAPDAESTPEGKAADVSAVTSSTAALKDTLQLAASVAIGAIFSAGLTVSGMTRPTKVVGFLSVLEPCWDLSLIFVMASAIGLSTFAYQAVLGQRMKTPSWMKIPLLAKAYNLPSSNSIDGKLLLGGVFFGAGWGLSGMCPGPAMVVAMSAASGALVWGYLAAMLAGMALEPTFSKMISPAQAQAAKQ